MWEGGGSVAGRQTRDREGAFGVGKWRTGRQIKPRSGEGLVVAVQAEC